MTDGPGVRALFTELTDEFGRLDAVINVAGISRPTSWTDGTDADWRAVLEVHLDGYRNVLAAALPMMAAAGRGNILGVTSGSGWRAGDAGAYGCAKRAVAALTWQIGQRAPAGVSVNAMSPIAVTRMVTAALERAGRGASSAAAAGPLFGSMPEPEQLGPAGAYLASDAFSWCRGQVIFASGAEMAVIEQPRLLEVVRNDYMKSLWPLLEAVTPTALVPAETSQLAGGGSNPRFASAFAAADDVAVPSGEQGLCAVAADRPELAAALADALRRTRHHSHDGDFARRSRRDSVTGRCRCRAGRSDLISGTTEWEQILAEHDGIVDSIHSDARWARAVADYAAQSGRPVRLVMLTDALTSGGRSRAQSFAQHARNARRATKEAVAAFAVSVETSQTGPVAALAVHLLCTPEAEALSGAELVAAAGWFGLRSHPRPAASVSYGGPEIPMWLDDALRSVVR